MNDNNKIYGYIYCLENIKNNHKYIGQTTQTVEKRFIEHEKMSPYRDTAVYKAIKKYGIKNFICYQLDTAYSQEELDTKETYWIDHYNTYHGEGYNMTRGGQLEKQGLYNSDEKYVPSEYRCGKPFLVFDYHGNYIKTHTSQIMFASEIGCSRHYVNNSVNNTRKTVYGYILIFEDEFTEELLQQRLEEANKNYQPFAVFDSITHEFIGVWKDKIKCENDIGFHHDVIRIQLNKNKPFKPRGKYISKYICNCTDDELSIINDISNKHKIHNEILVYEQLRGN